MKYRFLKLISIILAFLTLVTVSETSLTVFAEQIRENTIETEFEDSSVADESSVDASTLAGSDRVSVPYIVGEDESARTENTKTFRQSDGSFISSVYQDPVHFENAEGEWEDIDNTLIGTAMGYSNRSSDFNVDFNSETESDELFTLTYKGASLSVSVFRAETEEQIRSPLFGDFTEETEIESEESERFSESELYPEEFESENETYHVSEENESISELETFYEESETETGDPIPETDMGAEIPENDTNPDFSGSSDMTDPVGHGAPDETDSQAESVKEVESSGIVPPKEITILSDNEKKYTNPALLRTAAEVENDLKKQNPDASDEEINAAIARQNEINEEQRIERMTPERLTSSIVYKGLIPGAEIRYDLESKRIKESIVISESTDNYEYSFYVDTALFAEKTDEGEILFSDVNGEPVFTMPSPYMYDAAGEVSYDVEYLIDRTDDGYILAINASSGWINAPERRFPVVVDPTVYSAKTNGTDWNIQTQYVASNNWNNLHYEGPEWMTGAAKINGTFVKYYSYLRINALPTIPVSCKFNRAYLFLPHADFSGTGITSFNLTVKEALSNWVSEFSSNATNSNPIVDYLTLSNSNSGHYVNMNVTNALRNWYDGGTNNGLVFASQRTNGSAMTSSAYATSTFIGYTNTGGTDYSTPFLAVEYRNVSGVENMYSYETFGADGAGTAYVSHFSGYMTLFRDDVAGNGYTLTHVYGSNRNSLYTATDNINTVDYSNMKIGFGWKLNAQQSVISKTLTGVDGTGHASQIEYLIYADADGTEHYFHKDSSNPNLFRDEDGLGLTLTRSGNTITMTDEKGAQMKFIYGYLSQIIDRNGNKTVFLYDTTSYSENSTTWLPKSSTADGKNCLRKIVYIPNGGSVITCATLDYNSSGYLSSIKDRSNTIAATYSTGYGYLNSISEYGQRVTNYTYTTNTKLTAAYDAETKFGEAFTYSGDTGKILSVSDYTASSVNGTRTYYHKFFLNVGGRLTKFRDCGLDKLSGGGDDTLSVYVFDSVGRTVTAYSQDSASTLVGVSGGTYTENAGTSKTNNRLTNSASTGTVGHNLLLNSGFESGSLGSWSAYTNGTGHYSVVSSAAHRTGNYSVKAYCATYGGYSEVMQTVTLPKTGTYTFSAYVKIANMDIDPDIAYQSGVYLSVYKNGQVKAKGDYLKNENGILGDDWIRVYCVYSGQTGEQLNLYATLSNAKGTVYFDDIQFEYNGVEEGNNMVKQNDYASPYNLLTNSKLNSNSMGVWDNGTGASASYAEKYNGETGYVIKIDGSPSSAACISQTINVNLPGTETYFLSGWAKASSVAPRDTSSFQITATVNYTDGTYKYFSAPFSTDVTDTWQYAAKPVIPDKNKTVSTITVTCSYKKNANTAYFDEIALFRESAQAYTYNDDGKVVAVNQTKTDELSNTYSGADLISQTGGASGTVSYDYDNHHNVTGVTNGGVNLTLTYDGKGNATSSRLGGTNTSLFMK
ncbi:MAG: carbohydrate binding domain-containing protein, partial [Clostridia bacterium]|nr:carbohydrate binding domain-containing protein [Clostridia bacterium]